MIMRYSGWGGETGIYREAKMFQRCKNLKIMNKNGRKSKELTEKNILLILKFQMSISMNSNRIFFENKF